MCWHHFTTRLFKWSMAVCKHMMFVVSTLTAFNNFPKETVKVFSAPDSAQLRVYYTQIWILTHRLEICASSWCIHIFKAIEVVDGYLGHQRNKISKVQNTKLCLPNHIPVRNADCFKCHFWHITQLIGQKFTSFLSCHFLSAPLFSLWLKICRFYLAKKRSAAKSDENRWGREKY